METSNSGAIIADTSGLVSLFSPDDRNHAEVVNAAKRLQNEQRDILIPAAVLVEFLNVMGRKTNHNVALAVIPELTPPFLILNEPSHFPNMLAYQKFETLPKAVSFTDCIVMAVADDYGTKDIFGFDQQFEDAGYSRLKPSTQ
jgi:predicted nucleic acid-binding protein